MARAGGGRSGLRLARQIQRDAARRVDWCGGGIGVVGDVAMSVKIDPCATNDAGQVTPCNPLQMAVEDIYGGKGVRHVRLTKLTDGNLETGRSFISLKSGLFKKRGVIVNFCPFCGTNIGAHMQPPKTEAVQP